MLSFSYLFKTVSISYGCLLQRYCHFSMTQRWVAVIQNTEQSSCSAVGNSVESELSVIQNSAQSLGHRWVTVFYIWIDEPKQIHILCLSAVPDSAELSCSAVRETIELKLSAVNYIDDPLYFLIILVFFTKKGSFIKTDHCSGQRTVNAIAGLEQRHKRVRYCKLYMYEYMVSVKFSVKESGSHFLYTWRDF